MMHLHSIISTVLSRQWRITIKPFKIHSAIFEIQTFFSLHTERTRILNSSKRLYLTYIILSYWSLFMVPKLTSAFQNMCSHEPWQFFSISTFTGTVSSLCLSVCTSLGVIAKTRIQQPVWVCSYVPFWVRLPDVQIAPGPQSGAQNVTSPRDILHKITF